MNFDLTLELQLREKEQAMIKSMLHEQENEKKLLKEKLEEARYLNQ